jgi:hypothetical protein
MECWEELIYYILRDICDSGRRSLQQNTKLKKGSFNWTPYPWNWTKPPADLPNTGMFANCSESKNGRAVVLLLSFLSQGVNKPHPALSCEAYPRRTHPSTQSQGSSAICNTRDYTSELHPNGICRCGIVVQGFRKGRGGKPYQRGHVPNVPSRHCSKPALSLFL